MATVTPQPTLAPAWPGARPDDDGHELLPILPGASPRVVRSRPMAWAVVAVAAAAIVAWLATKSAPSVLLAVALLLVVVHDGALSFRALADPSIELRNPPDAVAGGHVTYLVRANRLRRPLLILPAGPFRQHAVLVEHDGPGMITLPAPPRGVVRYLVLDLISTSPLGLIETQRRALVPLPVPMLVAPPLLAHTVDDPLAKPVGFGEVDRAPSGDELFRGIRDYVRGDPRRKIHWAATARHRQLMVKETDGSGSVAIRIVLVNPLPGPAAEVAAGRAAWLAESCAQQGWAVHLVTVENPGEPVLPGLGRPLTPLPRLLPPPARPPRTVSRKATQRMDVARRLSRAGYGEPVLEPWRGLTRVVTPAGDRWL